MKFFSGNLKNPTEPLVDRAFLEKLERLTIRWQKSFRGLVGGHMPSRFAGGGQEFLDHRQFHHGDDLRGVNWRAYLRFEKLFLKVFHAEPRIPMRLMLDISRSMDTGDGAKFRYARRLAAALAYVGLVKLDSISIVPFHEGLAEAFVCTGGRHRFAPAADFLNQLRPAGATRFLEATRQFTSRFTGTGLLIIISDFLSGEGWEKPLQLLADIGHELFLIQVWDEVDRTPPWRGRIRLEDAESAETLDVHAGREAARRYTEAFDAYSRALQRVALSSGGRYTGLSTEIPVDTAIFGPIARQGGVE